MNATNNLLCSPCFQLPEEMWIHIFSYSDRPEKISMFLLNKSFIGRITLLVREEIVAIKAMALNLCNNMVVRTEKDDVYKNKFKEMTKYSSLEGNSIINAKCKLVDKILDALSGLNSCDLKALDFKMKNYLSPKCLNGVFKLAGLNKNIVSSIDIIAKNYSNCPTVQKKIIYSDLNELYNAFGFSAAIERINALDVKYKSYSLSLLSLILLKNNQIDLTIDCIKSALKIDFVKSDFSKFDIICRVSKPILKRLLEENKNDKVQILLLVIENTVSQLDDYDVTKFIKLILEIGGPTRAFEIINKIPKFLLRYINQGVLIDISNSFLKNEAYESAVNTAKMFSNQCEKYKMVSKIVRILIQKELFNDAKNLLDGIDKNTLFQSVELIFDLYATIAIAYLNQGLKEKSIQTINLIPQIRDYRSIAQKKLALSVEDDHDLFLEITLSIKNVHISSELLDKLFSILIMQGKLNVVLKIVEGMSDDLLKSMSYEFISQKLAEAGDMIKAEDIASKITKIYCHERAYAIILKTYLKDDKIDKVIENWSKISITSQCDLINNYPTKKIKSSEDLEKLMSLAVKLLDKEKLKLFYRIKFFDLIELGDRTNNYEFAVFFMNRIPADLKFSIIFDKCRDYLGRKRKDLARSLIYNIQDIVIKSQMQKEFGLK